MAAGLNVIPIGNIQNALAQQFAQDLRNLQVGRAGFKSRLAIIARAVEASGGSAADLGAIFGITSAQAQILHDEASSFATQLNGGALSAAWDQINAIFGV